MNTHAFPALVKIAASFSRDSAEHQALRRLLASAAETYYTKGGFEFNIKTVDFARFLADIGVEPGMEMGRYLREEVRVDDDDLPHLIKRYRAQTREKEYRSEGYYDFWIASQDFARFLSKELRVRDPKPYIEGRKHIEDKYVQVLVEKYNARADHFPQGPEISELWAELQKAVWDQAEEAGTDVGDMYANWRPSGSRESFEQYLEGVSGDVGQSFDYALSGKALKLWDKFVKALRSREYLDDGYEKWDLRGRTSQLQETYASGWHTGMTREWEKLQRNPREMARLDAIRQPRAVAGSSVR